MRLTPSERHLISDIDCKIKNAKLLNLKPTYFLNDIENIMPKVKTIIYSRNEKEIDLYMQGYEGFKEFVAFAQK